MPSSSRGQATIPRRRLARYLLVSLAILVATVLSHPTGAAPTKEIRRVLILNEGNPSYPAIRIINQGIQTALSNAPYRIQFYSEYFDTPLFPDPAVQQEFRDFYVRKYRNRQPDVIITVGPTPLKFMQEAHQRAFPGVPIVFCLPTGDAPSAAALGSDFTGIESDMAAAETLQMALKLQPETEHVVVLGGVSDRDKHEQALLKQQIKRLTDHLEITYMTDVAVPELPERLKHLPRRTLVLLLTYSSDTAGIGYKSNEIGPLVAAAANAPVFTFYDVYLNHGEVGGYLSNFNEQGKVAGNMALKILQGAKPQDIPRVKGVNTYMFDWQAVKRWGLKESVIPPGSIVLNREPTPWELYKSYIFGGIVLILFEALLIVGLLRQRMRRREAENELGISNDRLRLAVEAGKCVGWDWNKSNGRNYCFGDLQTVFGIESDTYAGQAEDFRRLVYPQDLELVEQAILDAGRNGKPYDAEFRVVRTDGTVRWLAARGKFDGAGNGDLRMLGMAADVTERRKAEEARRQKEVELEKTEKLAKVGAWQWDTETDAVSWSEELYRIAGLDPTQPAPSFKEHPKLFTTESWERLSRAVGESLRTGTQYKLDLEMPRPDGTTRWVIARGEAIRDDNGRIAQLHGMVQDITDRKKAEHKLRESEERFRLVANTAPVMIWMSDIGRLFSYFNQPWLEFTGCSTEAELGKGWVETVHPEDLGTYLDIYWIAFVRREPFQMEYRVRRHDGEYRWILDHGVPRFDSDGTFAGYIGSCIDVTGRKLAEDALATVGRRLIEAHEEERTWIARELHDDILQRLAVLAYELDQWGTEGSLSSPLPDHLRNLQERIAGIATDTQTLSHRLHSSRLEFLGLAVAAKSYCEELSEKAKVEIDFNNGDMPSTLPKEVSLCLFRVMQEALQNAVKHSGVLTFKVELSGTQDSVELKVADSGRGFEVQEALTCRGLGLVSMRERLQIVHGELKVQSKPEAGTTIYARVPLKTPSPQVTASYEDEYQIFDKI